MNDQRMRDQEVTHISIARNISSECSNSPPPPTPPTPPHKNLQSSQENLARAVLALNMPSAPNGKSLDQRKEVQGLAGDGLSVIATQGESLSRGTGRYPLSEQYQLQLWLYEISKDNLPFPERFEQVKWRDCESLA